MIGLVRGSKSSICKDECGMSTVTGEDERSMSAVTVRANAA